MRQFKTLWKGMAAALAGGLLLCACSSEEEAALTAEGKGLVRIGLSADTGFSTQTKAVDESTYQNTDNYTVQILKDDAIVESYTGATLPEGLIELTNGTYIVKAFYGTDNAASLNTMYVEGSKDFDINSNQVSNVEVSCAPVCAKVNLTFEGMDEYFTDWETHFETTALGEETFIYEKDDTGPLYLKVNKDESVSVSFRLTNSEKKTTTIDKAYTMNPNEALNITIKPAPATSGDLGISISIDGSTNDETVDIEIPSDWI